MTNEQAAGLKAIRAYVAWLFGVKVDDLPSGIAETTWEAAYNCLDSLVDDNDLRDAVEAVQAEDRAFENTPDERTENVDFSEPGFWDRVEAKLRTE